MDVTRILTKTVGVVGLGLIGYDAHVAGKIESSSYQKRCTADGVTRAYENTMKLENPSVVEAKGKTAFFNYQLENNLSDFFTGIAGYLKGAGSMLVGNVIPLALSAGTVFTKGLASKACGIGLLAYGGIFFIQNILGIGKPKHLVSDF